MTNEWIPCTGEEQFEEGLYAVYTTTGQISVKRCERGKENLFPYLKRGILAYLKLPEPLPVVSKDKAENIRLNEELKRLRKEQKETIEICNELVKAIKKNDLQLAKNLFRRYGYEWGE